MPFASMGGSVKDPLVVDSALFTEHGVDRLGRPLVTVKRRVGDLAPGDRLRLLPDRAVEGAPPAGSQVPRWCRVTIANVVVLLPISLIETAPKPQEDPDA